MRRRDGQAPAHARLLVVRKAPHPRRFPRALRDAPPYSALLRASALFPVELCTLKLTESER